MFKTLCRKMMNRSCWVYHANSGGCNGCDIEVLNVLTPYYDAERFGVKLVASPRHADAMLCQGPALRSTAQALRRAYDAMPAPKVVIAIGSCAAGGGDPVRQLRGHGRRGEGAPGRLLRPRLPTPPRGDPARRGRGARHPGQGSRAQAAARPARLPLPAIPAASSRERARARPRARTEEGEQHVGLAAAASAALAAPRHRRPHGSTDVFAPPGWRPHATPQAGHRAMTPV